MLHRKYYTDEKGLITACMCPCHYSIWLQLAKVALFLFKETMRCICLTPPTHTHTHSRHTRINQGPVDISGYPNTHKIAAAKDCHSDIDSSCSVSFSQLSQAAYGPLQPHTGWRWPWWVTTVGVRQCAHVGLWVTNWLLSVTKQAASTYWALSFFINMS